MVDAEFFIHHWFPQNAQEKSFVARRQPTTPQAILTSILLVPCAARIPTLLQRRLGCQLTACIVNANLYLVEVLRTFLTACVGVGARLFRHC